MLTEAQIEYWRQLWQTASSDQEWLEHHKWRDDKRRVEQQALLALLDDFLHGRIGIDQFKATFDQKTRTEWTSFGLKGMSGAMFLNMLVKHIPDTETVTKHLMYALVLPESTDDAVQRMLGFSDYLDSLIASGEVARGQLQPARAPFFVSAWWHIQDTEQWPIYYLSARRTLEIEGLFSASAQAANDYFAFREIFLDLARALGLTVWEFEHLCAWHDAQHRKTANSVSAEIASAIVDEAEELAEEEDELGREVAHSEVQALLARIGKRLGCQIWIASNDHNRHWGETRLGDLSMPELPQLGLDADTQRIIQLIDVVWLKGTRQVAAAFEVEHTTSVYSGLLRLSDLVASSPNLNFPLYIVAPEARLSKVRRELARPTFRALELSERCGFFSAEELASKAESILEWASDPSVIERLARRLDNAEAADWG